jgi:hypothetical protein
MILKVAGVSAPLSWRARSQVRSSRSAAVLGVVTEVGSDMTKPLIAAIDGGGEFRVRQVCQDR